MIKDRTLSSAAYGTHITPLIAAVLATGGDVVELGMGDYSTPVLHEIVKFLRHSNPDKKLLSFESENEWHVNFKDLENEWHKVSFINDWDTLDLDRCGVLFIDHGPAERRIMEIERFRNKADIIIIHDTDKIKYYNYEPLLSGFKYRFEYKRYKKSTTLVSDSIDVSKLF